MSISVAGPGAKDVRAEINYVRNPPPDGAEPLTFITEDETQSTMVTHPGVAMAITDVRGTDTSLDREGFALVKHRSTVPDFHLIEEDVDVDQLYIDEMTELAKQITGASVVVMQGGGKKRYGKKSTAHLSGVLKNALPALYPHGDTTDASAAMLAQAMSSFAPGLDLSKAKRWAHINMWRPITSPPHDYPLAVCDAQTIGTDDAVTVMAVTETRMAGTLTFPTKGYVYKPQHRWCYFRDMQPDEVLLFKTHDSDPARAHQVAHTAFLDATCPPDAPTRGSIEMRAFCVFE